LSQTKVGIIDYGMGNLCSVENAFRAIGVKYCFVRTPEVINSVDRLLLPGVGSFNAGMLNLTENGLAEAIRIVVAKGTPLLGICLGMQLLVSHGDEGGLAVGLGLIPGKVCEFIPYDGLRIPHMGFNEVDVVSSSHLFGDIANKSDFYFVHGYHVKVEDSNDIIAVSTHGNKFVAAIGHGNVFGTQFHPEKSQSQGLQLLKNFCAFA